MRRKTLLILTMIIIIGIALYGCSGNLNSSTNASIQEKDEMIASLTTENTFLLQEVSELQSQLQGQPSSSILMTAMNVVELLKDQDFNNLSFFIHPTKGVRFTPYSYVDLQNLVFTSQQIPSLLQSSQIYNWGNFDGTGDPINLTFSNYYDLFVYDVDFVNPHIIGNNIVIGTGNSLNNIEQAYPNGEFVEFHFTGFDPGLFEMDWKSLRLVFEDVNGDWYLVGIIHDQWTI